MVRLLEPVQLSIRVFICPESPRQECPWFFSGYNIKKTKGFLSLLVHFCEASECRSSSRRFLDRVTTDDNHCRLLRRCLFCGDAVQNRLHIIHHSEWWIKRETENQNFSESRNRNSPWIESNIFSKEWYFLSTLFFIIPIVEPEGKFPIELSQGFLNKPWVQCLMQCGHTRGAMFRKRIALMTGTKHHLCVVSVLFRIIVS